jgi:phospholipid-binding lipoprotein MlaA
LKNMLLSLLMLRLRLRLGLLIVAFAVLSGCASSSAIRGLESPAPSKDNPLTQLPVLNLVDPFERYNRKVFEFNDALDRTVLKPAAEAYRDGVPDLVRTGVTNFFANYTDLWSATNSFLQAEPAAGFDNLLRFGLNTTFGLWGILDIAGEAGIERHKKDFGQTLARWGVRSGPYVILPLMGPTTVRDAGAFTLETRADVIRTLDSGDKRLPLYTLQTVNKRASLLRVSAALDDAALDRYSFTRDAFLQLRNNEIWDGNPPDESGKRADDDSGESSKPPKVGGNK